MTAGAWFFIVVSLLHVTFAIATMWPEPEGTFKLYHAVVGDKSFDALGLTYTGYFGLFSAITQALLVTAAAAVTVWHRHDWLSVRRFGHGLLCGWSALWAGNLIWLASVDGAADSFAQATLLSVLLLCTFGRAAMGWSPRLHMPPEVVPEFDDTAGETDPEFDRTLATTLPPLPPIPSPSQEASGFRATALSWLKRLATQFIAVLKRGAIAFTTASWPKSALSGLRRGIAGVLQWIAERLGRFAGRVTPTPAAPARRPGED